MTISIKIGTSFIAFSSQYDSSNQFFLQRSQYPFNSYTTAGIPGFLSLNANVKMSISRYGEHKLSLLEVAPFY
jgi:hypothetical protein